MAESVVTGSSSLNDDLSRLFNADTSMLAQADDLYRRIRLQAPVLRHGAQVILSNHADVDYVFRHPQEFASNIYVDGSFADAVRARIPAELRGHYDDVATFDQLFLWAMTGDTHRRVRTIIAPAFTPSATARLERIIADQCEELLTAAAESGEFDLVSEFAYRLPLLMISSLLGVSRADMEQIHAWSMHWAAFQGRNADTLEPWHATLQKARAYVDDVVERFVKEPPEAVLGRLLVEAYANGQMSRDELAAMFMGMLFAAHETTTNLIANGVRLLLQHPDQWRALCEDPSLAAGAVEETLRFESPSRFSNRVPVDPAEFGDLDVPAGQTLCLLLGAANRDPAVFDDPETYDIRRQNNRHIAFAAGPKYCVGAPLARMEGRIAFQTIARMHPDIRLLTDTFDRLPYPQINGLRTLPVGV